MGRRARLEREGTALAGGGEASLRASREGLWQVRLGTETGQGTSSFDNMILFLGPALGGDTLVRVLIERRGFPGIARHHPVGRRPRL